MTTKLQPEHGLIIDLESVTDNGYPKLGLNTLLRRLDHIGTPYLFASASTFFSFADYRDRFEDLGLKLEEESTLSAVDMLIEVVRGTFLPGTTAMVVGGTELANRLVQSWFSVVYPNVEEERHIDFVCVDPTYVSGAMEKSLKQAKKRGIPIYSLIDMLSHEIEEITSNPAVLKSIYSRLPLPKLYRDATVLLNRPKGNTFVLGQKAELISEKGNQQGFKPISSVTSALEMTDPAAVSLSSLVKEVALARFQPLEFGFN